jgi:hypothetical protein
MEEEDQYEKQKNGKTRKEERIENEGRERR